MPVAGARCEDRTRPGRGRAILLGVCTAWPPLYMIFFMCVWVGLMISMATDGREPPESLFVAIMILHTFTMVEIAVLLVVYLVHLFRTARVPPELKAVWAVVLLIGNAISMPIYWYFHIWRTPRPAAPGPPLMRSDTD